MTDKQQADLAYLLARRQQLATDLGAYQIKVSQTESRIRNVDARVAELMADAKEAVAP